MKKTRKKRIVRRKRRVSERRAMQIKRGLMKRAKKLRLGAKRTGAYVYGTLRRIVGNPGGRYRVGGGYKTFTLDEAKREAERIFRTTGNIVSIEEHRPTPQVAPTWKYGIYTGRGVVKKNPLEKMGVYAGRDGFEITDFKKGDRIQLHPGMDLWMRGAKYGQIIGIGRKKLQVKLDYLRRPIAISPRNIGEIMYREIGENRRRTAGRRRMVRVLGYDVVEGSKKHMRLLEQKRHFDDLQRSERGLRGNPFEPDKIMKLRRILEERQYAKIDGQVVDGVTARAILMVYDGLNEKNRARYSAMPIVKMANIAWKLVR